MNIDFAKIRSIRDGQDYGATSAHVRVTALCDAILAAEPTPTVEAQIIRDAERCAFCKHKRGRHFFGGKYGPCRVEGCRCGEFETEPKTESTWLCASCGKRAKHRGDRAIDPDGPPCPGFDDKDCGKTDEQGRCLACADYIAALKAEPSDDLCAEAFNLLDSYETHQEQARAVAVFVTRKLEERTAAALRQGRNEQLHTENRWLEEEREARCAAEARAEASEKAEAELKRGWEIDQETILNASNAFSDEFDNENFGLVSAAEKAMSLIADLRSHLAAAAGEVAEVRNLEKGLRRQAEQERDEARAELASARHARDTAQRSEHENGEDTLRQRERAEKAEAEAYEARRELAEYKQAAKTEGVAHHEIERQLVKDRDAALADLARIAELLEVCPQGSVIEFAGSAMNDLRRTKAEVERLKSERETRDIHLCAIADLVGISRDRYFEIAPAVERLKSELAQARKDLADERATTRDAAQAYAEGKAEAWERYQEQLKSAALPESFVAAQKELRRAKAATEKVSVYDSTFAQDVTDARRSLAEEALKLTAAGQSGCCEIDFDRAFRVKIEREATSNTASLMFGDYFVAGVWSPRIDDEEDVDETGLDGKRAELTAAIRAALTPCTHAQQLKDATVRDLCFGCSSAWPPKEVVTKLIEAVDHLLRDHDCDTDGHELFARAAEQARAYLDVPKPIELLAAITNELDCEFDRAITYEEKLTADIALDEKDRFAAEHAKISLESVKVELLASIRDVFIPRVPFETVHSSKASAVLDRFLAARASFMAADAAHPLRDERGHRHSDVARAAVECADAALQLTEVPRFEKDGPCALCGESTDCVAGDPGKWPLWFVHYDKIGISRPHHARCVTEKLRQLQKWSDEREKIGLALSLDDERPDADAVLRELTRLRKRIASLVEEVMTFQADLSTAKTELAAQREAVQQLWRDSDPKYPHNFCWVNGLRLFRAFGLVREEALVLPPKEERMHGCAKFWEALETSPERWPDFLKVTPTQTPASAYAIWIGLRRVEVPDGSSVFEAFFVGLSDIVGRGPRAVSAFEALQEATSLRALHDPEIADLALQIDAPRRVASTKVLTDD